MSEGMRFTIRFENNSKIVIDELGEAVGRALYAIGVKAVEGSVDAISGRYDIKPAVDTGRLRASISFITPTEKGGSGQPKPPNAQAGDELTGEAEQNTVVVGSNVEYAEKVHNGDSKMSGRPFITEGINRTKDKMRERAEKIFKGQL